MSQMAITTICYNMFAELFAERCINMMMRMIKLYSVKLCPTEK